MPNKRQREEAPGPPRPTSRRWHEMLDDSEDEEAHDRRTDTSGRPTPIFADESEAEEQAARAEAEDEEARDGARRG